MKIKLLYAVLLIQTTFFIALFAWHQTGLSAPSVLLRTVPVDPRDLLRGDYMILRYEVGKPAEIASLAEDQILFSVLKPDGKFFILDRVQTTSPSKGEIFLKGRY
ncbi:MAG: GDYXXLXY domain-containing protein, partial [Chthoniobacterales bacterium]